MLKINKILETRLNLIGGASLQEMMLLTYSKMPNQRLKYSLYVCHLYYAKPFNLILFFFSFFLE